MLTVDDKSCASVATFSDNVSKNFYAEKCCEGDVHKYLNIKHGFGRLFNYD